MGKFFLGLVLILAVIAGGIYYFYIRTGNSFGLGQNAFVKGTIDLSSQEFLNGAVLPIKYTCDWQNINPPFLIDRVPGDAKSLVLIIDDPDAKPVFTQHQAGGAGFTHWLVTDIDPTTTNIAEDSIPPGATIGTNDFDKVEYGGPCPPAGSEHKYFFRIFALDKTLDLPESSTRSEVDRAMKGHIIGKGEMTAKYSRPSS